MKWIIIQNCGLLLIYLNTCMASANNCEIVALEKINLQKVDEIEKAKNVLKLYKELRKNKTVECKKMLFESTKKIHLKLIEKHNDLITFKSSEDPGIEDKYMEKDLNPIGIETFYAEGMAEYRQNEFFFNKLRDFKLDPESEAYNILNGEFTSIQFTDDGSLTQKPEVYLDWIIKWNSFLGKYPNNLKAIQIEEHIKFFSIWLVGFMPNTEYVDSKGVIIKDFLITYKKLSSLKNYKYRKIFKKLVKGLETQMKGHSKLLSKAIVEIKKK